MKSIGIFDSGVGGLTVARQVIELLPNESVTYLGDTARVPYGNKDPQTILRYALECVNFLLSQDVKMLVIACNTICAYAWDEILNRVSIPVVGVIDSGLKTLLHVTKNNKVAILGTSATISSGIYPKEIKFRNPLAEVHSIAAPLFVPIVEEGFMEHKVAELIAEEYLASLKSSNIDSVLLACTHYPFLRKVIEKALGEKISVMDASGACAKEVALVLQEKGLQATSMSPKHRFFVSGSASKFQQLGEKFLGKKIENICEIAL
jgi:glutamate racemase